MRQLRHGQKKVFFFFLESRVFERRERDLVKKDGRVDCFLGRWPFRFQKFSIYSQIFCCALIKCHEKT